MNPFYNFYYKIIEGSKIMNIGILISRLPRVGPVNGIYNRLYSTNDASIKYIIFTFRPELLGNSRQEDFERLKVSVICLFDRNIFNIIKKLKRAVIDYKIDIIDAHCIRTLFFGSFIKIKKVFSIHQNYHYVWPIYRGIVGIIMVLVHDIMIKKWNKIICCAKYLEPMIKQYIRKDDVYHILNSTLPLVSAGYKKQKKENDNIVTYLYVGSIDKRKNVKQLCKEFSLYSKNNEQLICIGTGPDFSSIKNKTYSNIRMLGFQTNVKEYLFQADYFISMSKSEGLPNVVIEALACKIPVILSDIPAHREFFSLNEKIGILITKGLGNALKNIRSNNYEDMSSEAYNTYDKYLTSKTMADKYIEQYKSLLTMRHT
jgi:glycosyltransferase involved in cell wall biosynthesis